MNETSLKQKLIVVCGPTAVGKTTVAIKISRALNAEIVNADSMQVYRFMDIGTAKPTPEEQRLVTHHLIDIVNPDEPFDAARFVKESHIVIKNLHNNGMVPLVVGGTGLYIKALIHGLFDVSPIDPDIRNRLKLQIKQVGSEHMYNRLQRIDPNTAAQLHPNDSHRIIRAIEIYETTGRPISEYQKEHGFGDKLYQVLKIGLNMDRKMLYQRIDKRVDIMVAEGLIQEVKTLLEKGYSRDLKAMQSIGYRHMVNFLMGEMPWEETIRTLKRDTRRYAKRQMTWFKKDPDIQWESPEDAEEILQSAKAFINSE